MTRYCDIVMKGGITSGVVYPLAAVELSRHYRFRNVGGTSAGAIAAAAIAAAEHGRSTGQGPGFDEVAKLPDWLGTNLTSVFVPAPGTRSLFRILLAASAGKTKAAKAFGALGGVLREFWPAALLGAIPGVLLAAAAIGEGSGLLLVWGLVCALALIVIGVAAGLAVALFRRAGRALPENGFGLVSGGGETVDGNVPLSEWLADLLDRLAGMDDRALTFGDLWGSGPERELNLEMITTCVSQVRPYKLPFSGSEFWFDPDEMRRVFPDRIVEQMVSDARADDRAAEFAPLVPLPDAAKLPVVVGVRMSLSFPLLISAVPLHAIDYSQPVPEGEQRRPRRAWFSDGGITSNFPVHFFDGPVPRWPTFAIDLRKLPPGWTPSDDEAENVWMVPDNDSKGDVWWHDWEQLPAPRRLFAFLQSILRTALNWSDQTQSQVHGYRDRIVHIEHSSLEGGLNLTMPEDVIARLTKRGERAGELLQRRFAVPPPGDTPMTWDNQRWIRYRSYMHLLEGSLARLRRGCAEPGPGDRSIEELSRRASGEPPEFGWSAAEQQEWALAATAAAIALSAEWEQGAGFGDGTPQPEPEIRIVPRL